MSPPEQPLPRAMLIDLDDTIIVAGDRPAVLAQIAGELAAELAPHPPGEIAARLEAALEAFWSYPARHRAARFGIPEARRQVMVECFTDLASPVLTAGLAAVAPVFGVFAVVIIGGLFFDGSCASGIRCSGLQFNGLHWWAPAGLLLSSHS